MGRHHACRFPGETEEYRTARDDLLAAEMELRQKTEDVAALRRKLPLGGKVAQDYAFEDVLLDRDGTRPVRLSELFGPGKDTLIVYGFMYGPAWDAPCPSCTSITDSSNGIAPHVRQRTNFVTVAKAPPEKLKAVAARRGWRNIRLLSSHNNSFNADYLAQGNTHDDQNPIINVFVRHGGDVHHFWASELLFVPMEGGHPRHVDLIWPLWNFLDMTPDGRGDFAPELEYGA